MPDDPPDGNAALPTEEQRAKAAANRVVIQQALRIIMECYEIEAIDAFAMLRCLSHSSNTKLPDIASTLVSTGTLQGVGLSEHWNELLPRTCGEGPPSSDGGRRIRRLQDDAAEGAQD